MACSGARRGEPRGTADHLAQDLTTPGTARVDRAAPGHPGIHTADASARHSGHRQRGTCTSRIDPHRSSSRERRGDSGLSPATACPSPPLLPAPWDLSVLLSDGADNGKDARPWTRRTQSLAHADGLLPPRGGRSPRHLPQDDRELRAGPPVGGWPRGRHPPQHRPRQHSRLPPPGAADGRLMSAQGPAPASAVPPAGAIRATTIRHRPPAHAAADWKRVL